MPRLHSHPCARCGQKFGCGGELIRNFDGEPAVVCEFYHVAGERDPIFKACEDCAMTEWCANRGAQPVTLYVEGDGLCAVCAHERKAATA
jgi:hypothetical protein